MPIRSGVVECKDCSIRIGGPFFGSFFGTSKERTKGKHGFDKRISNFSITYKELRIRNIAKPVEWIILEPEY